MNAWISDAALSQIPTLRHAVTTRDGGVSSAPFDSLNVGLGSDDAAEHVQENRRRVALHLGFDRLLTPYQVHGADVRVVTRDTEPRPRCDALVTNEVGVLIGVLGADCPGVLLVDAEQHALAVAHAGWRGTAAGVVPAALRALTSRFGATPGNVRAWIGPAIGRARYEVDSVVVDAVQRALPASIDLVHESVIATTRPGHAGMDLQRAIRLQLCAAGVLDAHVSVVDACTYDDSARFFSYRRDGSRTGRHALVAGWIE